MVYFSGSDIVLFVIGFFLPPLAVLFKRGCGVEFLVSLLLSLLGYLPGIIHAWWVIYTNREDPGTHRLRDGLRHHHHHPESGRRTYVAVASTPPQSATGVHQYQHGNVDQQHHQGSNPQTYTTTTVTQDGPVRTTRTTRTTQHVVQVPADKKDQNTANPTVY